MNSFFNLRNIYFHHAIGLVFRLTLVLYGYRQDRVSAVPYTDVDYHVVTDSAFHVLEGGSPYDRRTYRYTPILAWMMLPNVLIHDVMGKLVFCLLDHIASHIIYLVTLNKTLNPVKSALLWLYNPFVIGISTRGSNESLVIVLVLAVLYAHTCRRVLWMGVMLGIAIHVKIYPIIFALPLYLGIEDNSSIFSNLSSVSRRKLTFVLSCICTFTALTYSCYHFYGWNYIEESFLYHVSRVDTRHNFSVYFYLLYLLTNVPCRGLGLLTLTPQLLAVAVYGLIYGSRRKYVPLAMFAQVFAFVTFNRVVTSQYFLWYLMFVPVLYADLEKTMPLWQLVLLPMLWIVAQASWLFPAFLLEFKGMDCFLPIFLEGIAFFCCNVGTLLVVTSNYFNFHKSC